MNRNFKLQHNPHIHNDIQKQVTYYLRETKSHELGKRFVTAVKTELKRLEKYALHYEIKYDNVRCLPIPKFPFRAHYRVNEENKIVRIEAIISTHEDPDNWTNR